MKEKVRVIGCKFLALSHLLVRLTGMLMVIPCLIGGCQPERKISIVSLPEVWLWDTCRMKQLEVDMTPIPSDAWPKVVLPHKILLEDQAMWYVAEIKSSADHYLFVEADDGAQIFYDEIAYSAFNGYYYKLPESDDSCWLKIRVLNNGKQGGLKKVQWKNRDSLDLIWSEQNNVLLQLEEIYLSDLYRSDVFLPIDGFEVNEQQSIRFTCWGDSQGGWDTFQSLCNLMLNIPRLDFSIGLGDLVMDGSSTAQWYSFLTCLIPLIEKRVQIFPLAGAHDYNGYYDDLIPQNYLRHFTNRKQPTYTSWSAGPAIFMALNPNGSFPLGLDSVQYQWALNRMNSLTWQQATWRFVLVHQPPYAQGRPGYEGDDFIRSFADTFAEQSRIDFVLSGHCHDFEFLRKMYGNQKTHFLVTGGAGGQLEPHRNDDRVQMDTIINEHHFVLFDLNDHSAGVQLYDERGRVIWSKQFGATTP